MCLFIFLAKGVLPRPPRPPLPNIDTCTPRGGTCINSTYDCEGFIDAWRLCRDGQTCCKPAPSTSNPEPPYPGKGGFFSNVSRVLSEEHRSVIFHGLPTMMFSGSINSIAHLPITFKTPQIQ